MLHATAVSPSTSPCFSSRELARAIQTELNDKLANAVLFGALVKGGHARVELSQDELRLDLQPKNG